MPQVQDIFNRIAPVYDQMNDWLSLGQHRIWKQMTVQWSGAKPGSVAIDLCCGSGDLTRLLARQVGPSGQVYGVDFCQNLLEIAQNHYTWTPIEWMEADVLDLPFSDRTFNAATMGYGLRNVSSIPQALQELHRVLKPGATAAILDFHRPNQLLLEQFQQWYLNQIVVPYAQQQGLTEEYAYIIPSLQRFPLGLEQVDLAYQAGFTHAVHYPIAGGMMGVLVATKSVDS
ncbi:MAG: bifunctional demethylmenaquinone methyltransferase/2-methoxy-6-polyprenyl-1,4-benzoquinol methylase UbiE [Roseofilum sp. SBFL]|uniref:bifunctional demethylmenaquinone methyltransferase/2-methoxy-6-polyprenyl-1,4-benzoquinol methylase UbiE n=1 Tax=unclassified Roseofilum TaxID=2620099 RepID=UPI001B0C2AAA|nr:MULTISPECIES: bifunctional demethylmenaquinone methyltransferase/2-methoxy-6-polyprenyl-1,4-benzoquinol methylase UbiE [unclassified Roseofilum]MBP0012402.1 bifunctional demethylmenaquinone methyltransferase/2-methoxy-6-polyprenyl-1,4-benzoquinol methylase UbiE [Roseofilum sp. SID3]MBP0023413.1 bifunctional demethylmenaquinone methyltransferase/2-methoxy-6-polyprenyl-1,4-benzoquinol methylase UbiE [Roseofilum sp. SID2]MBP0038717.1 bifunctional demethylmenaquinone methyltransferase/2-methoxy-6